MKEILHQNTAIKKKKKSNLYHINCSKLRLKKIHLTLEVHLSTHQGTLFQAAAKQNTHRFSYQRYLSSHWHQLGVKGPPLNQPN